MVYNILILEDDKVHMAALRKIIKDLQRDIQVYCAHNVGEAYRLALEHPIHLFFVDIVLNTEKPGDASGLIFAAEIRGISKYKFTPLVFTTSLEDPKYCSYSQLRCFAYIEKPFSVSQIRDTILDALEFPVKRDENKFLYLHKEGIVYSVCIDDIVYIELGHRRIRLHCTKEIVDIPYKTCAELMQDLNSSLFVQCSRYGIVSRKYIECIDYTNRYIKMKHMDEQVEIGIIMKKKFKKTIENE